MFNNELTFESVVKDLGVRPEDLMGHDDRVQEIINTYPSELL